METLTTLQNETRDGTIPQVLDRLRSEQDRKLDAVLTEIVNVRPVVTVQEGRSRAWLEFSTPEIPGLDQALLPLSAVAHGQISERAGIPRRYYDRMLQDAPGLWRENIETWWKQDQKARLVRTFKANGEPGQVRAFLSDRFRVLDNLPFIEATLEAAQEQGIFHVAQAQIGEDRCYLRLLTERHQALAVGDVVQQGISISNSEVGSGKVKVQPFATILSCKNGMVSTRDYGQVHLGGELDPGILSDATVKFRAQAVWGEVRDFVKAALDPAHLLDFVRKIDEKAAAPVVAPRIAVANVVREFGLLGGTGTRILDRYLRDAHVHGESQWGVVQAVTFEAHESATFADQVALEELGGKLVEMETLQLSRLLGRQVSDADLAAALSN